LAVCAVTLITGCASGPGLVELNSRNTKIEPLYRVEQPAGTAAGQYAVGRMQLAEGRVDAAITRFRNALTLQPGYVEALNGLGVAYGRKGRYEEAEDAFRAALVTAPESAHLLNNLGYAQFKAGRLQEASASLRQALRLDPHNVRTRENFRQLIGARERAADARVPVTAAVPVPTPAPQVPAAVPAQVVLTMKPDEPVAAAPMRVEAATKAVPVPSAEPARSAGFEVVLAKSSDSVLVQVAPAVYEIRLVSAMQRAAAGNPTVPVAPAHAPKPAQARTSLAAIDRLEVSNGAGISRLATRTARRLAQMGAEVARVTNYPVFGQQRTEIHYRDGHAESAKRLGERLPVDARLVSTEGLRGDVDIRLVVGRDMVAGDVAAWWNETLDVARASASTSTRANASASDNASDNDRTSIGAGANIGVNASISGGTDSGDGWRHL
jgi:tetratricopeptide (TPR) repeat protein